MNNAEWLLELPKVELHLHLEGSMSVDTVHALASLHDADWSWVWDNGIPDTFSFIDFPDFGRQYLFGLSLLKGSEDLATITDDIAATLASQNVRYAELTSTAYSHFVGGMSYEAYRDGLNEGRRRAAARGVEVSWVIDIPRDLEQVEEPNGTVEFLESGKTPDGLIGIGLGGYEVGNPPGPFAEKFARARALGLASLPHAGETEGAASVQSAIDDLGAVRVGHGVRALEDTELVKRMADTGVFCEVCPTSNLLLGVIDDLTDHALPALLDAGVRLNINTDDPGWFATDLMTELRIGSDIFGLSPADHLRLQRHALDASYASNDIRQRLSAELDAVETE
jgi:aminodeoxyfutalosine deaminase